MLTIRIELQTMPSSKIEQQKDQKLKEKWLFKKGFRENIVLSLNLCTASVFTNQTGTVFTCVKCGKSVAITLFSKKPPIVIVIT